MHEDDYTIPFTGNKYCGPAALAYVMRSDPDAAAKVLREVSGKRQICRLHNRHMLAAFDRLGMEVRHEVTEGRNIPARLRPSLRSWLEQRSPEPWEEFVVTVTGHYIVVHGDRYFDSMCHLGKPLAKCPWLRKKVRAAWLVQKEAA